VNKIELEKKNSVTASGGGDDCAPGKAV